MKRDRLFVNGLVRLAACVLMVVFGIGSAWGQSSAPINPAFKKWQKGHEIRAKLEAARSKVSQATAATKARTRLKAVVPQDAEDNDEESRLGAMPEIFDTSYLANLNTGMARGIGDPLPRRYDLREQGGLSPVRDQGRYGTCWAHAVCASLESGLMMEGKGEYDFSEKNMVMRHGFDWDFDGGGNAQMASAYLLRWNGPVLESEDGYPDDSYYYRWLGYIGNPYPLNSLLPVSLDLPPVRHVQNVRWVAGRTSYLDNDNIKAAIVANGALYVTYYHASAYYYDKTASYYFGGNKSRRTNHAVTIVGWDDDYPASNFVQMPSGNGAFIVRNSWGNDWGDGGYFYVSYYDESFAWDTLYEFSNTEDAENYDAVYQYDLLGLVGKVGYKSETAWGADIFTALADTYLSAVGFYALVPNTSYTINIYTECERMPTSGNCVATQSGKTDSAGFFTVPLTNRVALSEQQRFSVVLKLTTPDLKYPLAIEFSSSGYSSEATALADQTFASMNGSGWYDLANLPGYPSASFCCKAYTKSAAAVKPALSSLAISGVSSLTSGQTAQFSCEATYSDGSKKSVEPIWSITEGRNYATISTTGLVTAKNVDEQQLVSVTASYAEDGITKEATWGFYVTIAAPDAPADVMATEGTESSCVRVSWAAPRGATEYAVYRATANNSRNAQYLENVTVARYNDTSAKPGVDYWYFIKAKNSSGTSREFSNGANGWRKLSPPEDVTASDDLLDKVALSWSEAEGAKYYRVYRAADLDSEKVPLSGWQTARSFDDTTAVAGVIYCYYIVAAVDASGNRPSDYSIVDDGMRAVPVTVDHLEVKGDAVIAAGSHADYTADAIYTDGHKVENVSPVTWTVSGDSATASGNRVTAAAVISNKTVTLNAAYAEDGITATGEKSITIAAVKPVAPSNVTATATAQGVALSWHAVSGAASYKVYRDGSAIGIATATTYTDGAAIPGVAYSYSVSSVNGAGEGSPSSSVSAMVPLTVPTGVAATGDRTDGVLVSWVAVNGATHYRVARAATADGEKAELGSWQTATSFLDTTAPVDTPLYYFVRAATSSSGANASVYSASVVGRVIPNVPQLLSIAISGPDRVAASGTSVYSCTATYSDETSEAVSPSWSASGAGAIDANGLLTASAVAADSTVTITASYEGKTATKEVKVIAPAGPSATVSNIRVTPRWPFSALVDIDYTLATTPVGTKALITLSGHDNDHNMPLAAKTLTGDGASGAVAAGEHRITWNIGADNPGFHAKSFDVNLEAVPYTVAVPGNVSASSDSTSAVNLSWDAVEDATGYEVWRGTGPTTNGAERVAVVTDATAYSDTFAIAGTTYNYWLRSCSEEDFSEFSSPVTGTRLLVVPVSLAISGASSVVAGETATYSCAVTRNDGTSGTVAPTWNVTDGSAYASINASGVLTANGIATSQSVTIQASYTQNGTTATETKTVTINTKSVIVTFEGNGGTASDSSRTYTVYGAYSSLPSASCAGYIFAGWFTDANGGDEVTASTLVDENVTVLYAHWTAQTFLVTLDQQGGSNGTASVTATYGSAMPAITVPIREGYTFGGYYANTNGIETQYYTASGDSAHTWNVTNAATLYAQWEVNALYLVIDLSGGPSASSYPISYLSDAPVGGWTDEYKTTKLVLRRIEAGSFKMCGLYDVTLTEPYYIGVFEVTRKQYELVTGVAPSSGKGDMRPIGGIHWDDIRGGSSTYNWPSTTDVNGNTFIGHIQTLTGCNFDLPTEAQWEYACRAGTTSAYNNGGDSENDLKLVGRYNGNANDGKGGYSSQTTVGSYQPNAWGIFDMHGNLNEWCLDWYGSLSSGVTNPVGPSTGTHRVVRGGSWGDYANSCTSSARSMKYPADAISAGTFRLCCPAQ